ncbi:VWFA domain-containing protein [Caenorhabditis elegans]|uniref:VWFA domain-containing protein n=1 Tax=Caenorhabditis elegans TaxID=6239 RepID=Q23561_CAEEL|nr:VWFA domain-containing protein [Caenorhabditis elegans]CAA88988.1 VWFA domain-containing protein [Caenorhabditis elegans]|eukprot:NP_496256.1 C-type LECtin [Caenorhabditis elegans]
MNTVFACLAIFVFGIYCSPVPQNAAAYTDPACPGNIKNLWLDVVVVVDRSMQMTDAQLWQVRQTLTQVFGSDIRIGTGYSDKRSTCVGFVTYNSNATVTAELDIAKSFPDIYNIIQGSLVDVASTNASSLGEGLLAAQRVLNSGRQRTNRYNVKQVILAFAADFQDEFSNLNAIELSRDLQSNGISIITVACTKDSYALPRINMCATPGYAFVDEMNTSKLVKQLTGALININCFCPEDWVQYTGSDKKKLGVCIKGFDFSGSAWGYDHAVQYCQNQVSRGHLANEFSKEKHDFINLYMMNTFNRGMHLDYSIGLRYLNSTWVWEEPKGQPKLPLNPDIYSTWAPGYPQKNSTGQVVGVKANGILTNWVGSATSEWLFVCQVQSSSTEHYTTYVEQQ